MSGFAIDFLLVFERSFRTSNVPSLMLKPLQMSSYYIKLTTGKQCANIAKEHQSEKPTSITYTRASKRVDTPMQKFSFAMSLV